MTCRHPLAILFLLLVTFLAFTRAVSAREAKRILVLHASHEDERTGEILRGIRSVLPPQGGYEFHVECMDSAASGDPEHLNALEQIYRSKYGVVPLDLVIATDDGAARFALERGRNIFGETPLVFCGIREIDESLLAGRAYVTGVLETVDYLATLETALRLAPRAKAVHILSDRTPAGLAALESFRLEAARAYPWLTTTPLLPERDWNGGGEKPAPRLSELPPDDFAFLLAPPRNAGGELDSLYMVSLMREINIPVFGCLETMVGQGLVGGKCGRGFSQGKAVAGLGASILDGEPPGSIPIVRDIPGEFLFDYRELSNHGMEREPLPAGAVLINAPDGFYRITKPLAVTVLAVAGILITLSTALLFSERKHRQTQKRLREGEAVYRTLVDNIELGITLIDKNFRIVMANRAKGSILGRSAHAMTGRTCHEEFHKRSEPCLDCPGRETMTKSRPASREISNRRGDGTPFTVFIRAFPVLDEWGTPTGFIEVVEDITEKRREEKENRRLEDRVREAQKLQSLGIMAGGVAHDFNNLLLGILGNADLALSKLPRDTTVREPVEKIISITGRAADLSNQMLAYSGKGRFDLSAVDVSALVREMAHLLGTVISKKARLALDLPSDLPFVLGDATQLRQVVMNLITNASESIGPAVGEIRLSTGSLTMDRDSVRNFPFPEELSAGPHVYVEVSDTGCGMDSATKEKIFDPFFSTKKSGRGLGLAAVSGIMRGHRGAINVESAPGEGTVIRVLLPVGGAELVFAEASAHPPTALKRAGMTALIAEDEEDVREITTTLLEEHGYSVIAAADGQEAVDRFREASERIDFVLLDMTMPRLGGDDVLRIIRKIRPDVPVIVCSGYSGTEAVSLLSESNGSTVFLQKPYRLAALFHKIEELFGDVPGKAV